MKKVAMFVVVAALLLVLAQCAPASTPAPAQPSSSAGTAASTGTPQAAGGQAGWDSVLQAAKKEGTLTIYCTSWGQDTQKALTEAFWKKYGIDSEFMILSRGVEVAARAQTEKSAGLFIADVFGTGSGTLLPLMKPQGLLGNLESALMLPEVTDPKIWGGRLPFLDDDKKTFGMVANTERFILYNTDLVKKGEITTYKDLLNPRYKGKIILNDPAIAGAGNTLFLFLADGVWDLDQAKDFLQQLITQQDVVISRDARLLVETVARGKYSVVLGPSIAYVKEFFKAGAPVDLAMLKEGTSVNATNGTIAVPATVAHPNASKVFLNWLLTQEGQTVFTRGMGIPSMRTDVPIPAGMDPRYLPQPGEKLSYENEEMVFFRTGKMATVLEEVMKQASK